MKESASGILQRVGGWCEPMMKRSLPLSELSVRAEGNAPLYCADEWPHCGNLGGNTESFRPMVERIPIFIFWRMT